MPHLQTEGPRAAGHRGSAEGSRDGAPGLLAGTQSVPGFTCPRSGPAVAPDPPLSLSVKGEAGCHLSLMKGDKDSLPGALREIPPLSA